MNFGTGLKRIINVPFWIWIIVGVIILLNNNAYPFLPLFFICIIVPILLRLILNYIIDGFFDKKG